LPHGLLVAGWGAPVSCETALGSGRVTSGNGLSVTFENALTTDPVPYIVDFSYTLQQPIPRPFYCTSYNRVGDGWSYFNMEVGWFFFTLPNQVTIDIERFYVSPNWTW
jgi:hypothetical protein